MDHKLQLKIRLCLKERDFADGVFQAIEKVFDHLEEKKGDLSNALENAFTYHAEMYHRSPSKPQPKAICDSDGPCQTMGLSLKNQDIMRNRCVDSKHKYNTPKGWILQLCPFCGVKFPP